MDHNSLDDLKRHIYLHHLGGLPFKCPVSTCSVSAHAWQTEGGLQRHIKKSHPQYASKFVLVSKLEQFKAKVWDIHRVVLLVNSPGVEGLPLLLEIQAKMDLGQIFSKLRRQ